MWFAGVAAALLLAGLAPGADAAPAPGRKFPVFAWIGPPPEETTVERYRELAEAGFTHSFSFFPNADAMARALDVAHAAGVQLYLSTPELSSDPEGTVRRFMQHPALAGYHLRDEPGAGDFPQLAEWTRRIQAVDREHPCYINLFPNYASPQQLGTPTYREHVRRFVAEVPVPILSFDHYPVTFNGLRPEWYENLEIAAEAARAAGKPLWAFALSVAHDPYPIARVEHLRLQVFSNLAYGAQGIQYFTYWTPESTVWNFHQAPIERDGKRTVVFNRIRQVNRELQGLAPVFLGARVLRVGHTGALPRGTQPFRPEGPVAEVETSGEGAVVSLLENGARRYLAVVNRDYRQPMTLTVGLDGSRDVVEVRKDGSTLPVKNRFSARVEAGDIVVLRW